MAGQLAEEPPGSRPTGRLASGPAGRQAGGRAAAEGKTGGTPRGNNESLAFALAAQHGSVTGGRCTLGIGSCIAITFLYFTLLYFALLHCISLYFTLIYFTFLYYTLLHITLLYSTVERPVGQLANGFNGPPGQRAGSP